MLLASHTVHEFCTKFDVTTAKRFPIHPDPINHEHHPIYAAKSDPISPHPHRRYSTQLVRCFLHIENRPLLLASNPIILQHSAINSSILTLNLQHGLWCNGFEHKVVIAVWAVFVAFLKFFSIFSEGLFALFAGKRLNVIRGDRCGEVVKEREKVPFPSFGEVGGFLVRRGIRRSQTIFYLEFCQNTHFGYKRTGRLTAG